MIHTSHIRIVRSIGRVRSAKGHTLPERALKAEWESVDAMRRELERPIVQDVRRLIREKGQDIVRGVERIARKDPGRLSLARKSVKDAAIARDTVDLTQWEEELRDTIESGLLDALEAGFQIGFFQMGLDATTLGTGRPEVRAIIDEILTRQIQVPSTILDAVGRDIQAGMREGETISEITARIQGRMDNVAAHKPRTIAQTSVTAGSSQAQQLAYEETGLYAKRWLSQRDGKVRATHTAADGQEVQAGDSFLVGSASLRFPGDPAAPAEEVVNCRCTTLPVRKEDAGTV